MFYGGFLYGFRKLQFQETYNIKVCEGANQDPEQNKEISMKNKRNLWLIVAIIAMIGFTFTACGDACDCEPCKYPGPCGYTQEQAMLRTETIVMPLGNISYIVRVMANLKRAEMDQVKTDLTLAISDAYVAGTNPEKGWFRNVFGRADGVTGVTIIVGDRPANNTFEIIGDGVTLYLNVNALNNADLQDKILEAVVEMNSFGTTIGKTIQPVHDKGWQRMNRETIRIANVRARTAHSIAG
jgi:hypothetical protein